MNYIIPNLLSESDCLTLLARIPSDSMQIVYVDPPWFPKIDKRNYRVSIALNAHLAFLSQVLQQCHRVIGSRGLVVFHATPKIENHIRFTLDQIFGASHYQTTVILPLKRLMSRSRRPVVGHDSLLFYSKTDDFVFNDVSRPLTAGEKAQLFSYRDSGGLYRLRDLTIPVKLKRTQFSWGAYAPPEGRTWRFSEAQLNEMFRRGEIVLSPYSKTPKQKVYIQDSVSIEVGSIWNDLPELTPPSTGKPFSQKPLELLERIILMTSDPDDTVLDPFCGAGVTASAASNLQRKWILCDSSQQAINATKRRLDVGESGSHVAYRQINESELAKIPVKPSFQYRYTITGLEQELVANPSAWRFLKESGTPVQLLYAMRALSFPENYYSCFISYSHADKAFAEWLYETLSMRGVVCWLDEHEILPGDNIYDAVNQGMYSHDKVLLCCSKSSLSSWWVDNEINKAFAKEQTLQKQRGAKVLVMTPIDLDGYLFEWNDGKADQVRSRLAADFKGWQGDIIGFERQIDSILKSLRADGGGRRSPPEPKL